MDSQAKLRSASSRTLQEGQAAIILLLIVGFGIAALVFGMATPAKESIERDKKTAAALARAKEALIGHAAGVDLWVGASRPGDLPCPDVDNDGSSDTPCASPSLGRLPWRTMSLPDLRDGDGERLWYAVSSNFKNSNRTSCVVPGDLGCLNSDARGTITVRDRNGALINNGNDPNGSLNPSAVIAVILAPGRVLQRQGAAAAQDRSCTVGVNCDAAERCTTSPSALTPKCNPVNYLDVLSGTEDNADFAESGNLTIGYTGDSTNGFIHGSVLDASGNVIVNDRLITITYQDLMPLLERRVTREANNCLNAYAADPKNKGRYPWASSMASSAGASPYSDTNGTRFGRLPDDLTNTVHPTPEATLLCSLPITGAFCMSYQWPGSCSTIQGTWWENWKNLVLYGVAAAYEPDSTIIGLIPLTIGVSAPTGCGSCLEVDPPSPANDKRFVVIVAGKRLSVAGGQPRSSVANRSDARNYVEDENDGSATQNTYTQKPASATFNDVLLYYQ